MMRYLLSIFLLVVFFAGKAQDVDGIVTVNCNADTAQSYCVYLPAQYGNGAKLPVIFLFDPAARGHLAVSLFKAVANELGIVVIASNNSKNGPIGLSLQAADALFIDAFKKYHLDETEVYLAGFSGGARVATTIALNDPTIAGVIACSGSFSEQVPNQKLSWYFTGIAGDQDFNYIEMLQVHNALDSLQNPNRLIIFQGSHRWPTQDAIEQALVSQYNHHHKITKQKQYVDALLPNKQDYQKELNFQNEVSLGLQSVVYNRTENIQTLGWWRSKQSAVKKALTTHSKADSNYVARQASFVTVNIASEFENCYQAKRYEAAEELLNIAAIFDGSDPMIAYRYARLAAAQNDESLTLSYLNDAVKKGLKDKTIIQKERAFYFLRENKRFKAIVN